MNPIVEKRERKNWGRKIIIVIITAVLCAICGNPLTDCTITARRTPLAAPVHPQERKAVRNRPPSNPSRGPVGLMVRQTPNSSNLKCFIFFTMSLTLLIILFLFLP